MLVLGRGSIVWGGGVKTIVWFFCDLRQFIVSSYSMLNWWYLYMFTIFILHICVYGIAWSCHFSILLMFVMIPLMSYANILCIIVDLCWLRFADVCHVVKLMIDIITYVMYVSIVWSCLISEFILNIFQDY